MFSALHPAPFDPPAIPTTPLISVVGARGGIGTSTLATSLALVAAEHHDRVALVDGAPRNCLEILAGIDEHAGPTWQDLDRIHHSVGSSVPRGTLGDGQSITVLAWKDMSLVSDSTVRWAIELIRGSHNLVIADAGVMSRPLEHALVESSGAVVLVVPGELRALTHAVHLVPMISAHAQVHLVVAEPSPAGVSSDQVADLLNLPLAGVLQRESRLPVRGEHGQLPTRRLRATADALLATLGF